MAEDGAVNAVSITGARKKRFHDGTKRSQYEQCKSWSYKRWAWEFLCRNKQFIAACDKVINGTDKEKALVAKKYGLVQFKYYGDVQTKNNVYPLFKDGVIKIWENLSNESICKKVNIFPGQVIIRFRLASDINAELALKAQLGKAEKLLKKKLAEYEKTITKSIGKKELRTSSFIESIRILDMLASGIESVEEISKHLYQIKPNSTQATNIDEVQRATVKKISTAKEYSEKLHRYIALKSGSPNL